MATGNRNRAEDKIRRVGPRIEPWQFEAVREAGLAVASELSLDTVLQKLVNLARDLINARYAALGVAREDLRGLTRFIVSGIGEEEISQIPHWPVGLGLLGVLLREPKPLRVKNIGQDPRSIGFPSGHPKMTSFLGVPIISKGRILGNFYFTEKNGADEFSQADENMIVLFAAHAAVAIENARLYTETNDRLREKIVQVERAEQRSRFLAELSSLFLSTPPLEDLPIEQVAARTAEALGDACAIYITDPTNPDAILAKAIYHSHASRAEAAKDLIEGAWAAIKDNVIEKRRPIYVADVNARHLPFIPLDPEVMKKKRFTAAMVLPLETANRSYGFLASLASTPLTFTDDDLSFGMLVAERSAFALEGRFLLSELTAALKTRDEFISVASHELKTPITALKGYAQAAAKFGNDPQLQQKALESINRQADRLVNLVNELLDVARLRAGRLEIHREQVDLVHVAAEVLQRFDIQIQANGLHQLILNSADPQLTGEWDPTRIEQILTNLVSNASKYSPSGCQIEVNLKKDNGKAVLSVSDRGIGIPRDQQSRVFEPFFRAANVSGIRVEGTGLGLHITKEIVERHGGRIWFVSEEGNGTTFFVELPLTP